jgi:hypothetical protein
MAQEHTCDCCKRSVEAVSEVGLCFVCETFQTFIKEETDLDDEDALNLAGALADHILSAIVDHLQVSNPSLLKDLLQTIDRHHTSTVRSGPCPTR